MANPPPRHVWKEPAAADRLDPWLALCVVAALVAIFHPLLGVGFTCDDDMFTATARLRFGGVFKAAWAMASGHGRFYHLVVYPLAQLPFLFDSLEVANAFRVLSSLSAFAAFFLMAAEWTGSRSLGALVTLLAAGLLETGHAFNPFHALPLWFNLGATLLFTSLFLFQRGLARGSSGWFVGAAVASFGAMLTYEVFVLYAPLFFLMAVSSGLTGRARSRALLPVTVSTLLYLALYLGFRRAFPTGYPGTQITFASPREMLRTVAVFSWSGLDLHLASPTLRTLSRHPMPWIALVAVAAGTYRGLGQLSTRLPPRRVVLGAAVVLVFVFVPNVLFGLTERYRTWAKHDEFYIGSFYSGFTAALFLGLAAWVAMWALGARRTPARVARVALSAALAVMAYGNVERARRDFEPHRRNREIWRLAEQIVAGADATGLREATTLVAPTLQRTPPLVPFVYQYWSLYLSEKLAHPVTVVDEQDAGADLPPGSAGQLGVVVRYWPELSAGLSAVGRLDAERWRRDRSTVPCFEPWIVLSGRRETFALAGIPPPAEIRPASAAAWQGAELRVRLGGPLVVGGGGSIDLGALELGR